MELNKIYCEDCIETMARMPDNFVDLVVTSPPYNIGSVRINSGFNRVVYDEYNDNNINYFEDTEKWLAELLRITKYHIFYNIQEITNNWGIIPYIRQRFSHEIKEIFIWAKTNPPSNIVDTMCSSGFEYILCVSKDNPSSRKFNYCNFSNKKGDYVRNVIIKPVNSNSDGHGFAFGLWLPKYFINYFSKEGDIIYDPFIGSGTTAIAAHQLKRNWIGSEISQEYVDLANKRLDPYLRQKTLW